MNYTLNCPSLEHIALVKIATTLWNQDDIRALMSKLNYGKIHFLLRAYERRNKWQEIENKVIEKVPQFSLPKSLKEEILGCIKPVGLQILKWINSNDEYCYRGIGLPSELCWTPQGTIQLKKTAEAVTKDESLDVTGRYKLACTYCLEDDVLELWNKIPENRRKSFYSGEDPIKIGQQDLVVLWMYNIKEEVNKPDVRFEKRRWQQERSRCSPYQYAFEYAATIGDNEVATEYFFQKLTSREREESLVRTAEEVVRRRFEVFEEGYEADVLCFLLSQMEGEQQMEVFKCLHYKVLTCLLEWPWQSLFVETANRMWDFLPEEDYDCLLSCIVDYVNEGHKVCQKLFGEFWLQSPNAHKRYVIDNDGFLLSSLFKIEDIENVKIILKDATLIEKRKIIFSDDGQEICQDLIRRDEWDLLRFFIRECVSSKDEMIKFKEEFEERLTRRYLLRKKLARREDNITWPCSYKEFPKKKDKFFQLLDDFINGYNKRKSVAEGDSSPA